MSTEGRTTRSVPLYARVLRLRRLRIGGLASFLFLECTLAAGILLALSELVSWWAVPVLPVLVAAVVKINDLVGAPSPTAEGVSRQVVYGGSTTGFPPNRQGGGRGDDQLHPVGSVRGRQGGLVDGGFADPGDSAAREDFRGRPADRDGAEWTSSPREGTRARSATSRHLERPRQLEKPHHLDLEPRPIQPEYRQQLDQPTRRWDTLPAARAGATEASGAARMANGNPPVKSVSANSSMPSRAYIIGAAVRRSMAGQSQYGSLSTVTTRANGRHARRDVDRIERRSGLNERHFNRTA